MIRLSSEKRLGKRCESRDGYGQFVECKTGGLYCVTYEAHFEAKASERSHTGGGNRRRIFVAGGRRLRGNRRTDGGYAFPGYRSAPNHPQ
jgi:hypothetical protein